MGLMDGISAAGYGAGKLYGEMSLEDQKAEIRQKAAVLAEEMKNAPLKRISAGAQAKIAEEVPLEAAPVTAVSGTNEAGEKFGFEGDIATQRKAIESIADPKMRAEALAQLEGQVATDTKTGLINVAGKTRKRTSDEALAAAVSDAKVNDLPAYADYEARVGKPLRDERRIDVSEKKSEAAAANAARESKRKEESDSRKDETQRYIAEMRDNTAQARIEALLQKTGKDSSGTKEALSFIDGVRKDLASEAANLKALYAADTKELSPAKREAVKKEYQPKFDAIEAKRAQIEKDFGALREKVGLPAMDSAAAPAAPGAKPPAAPAGLPQGARQIGTSGGKPVYETPDGKRFVQK